MRHFNIHLNEYPEGGKGNIHVKNGGEFSRIVEDINLQADELQRALRALIKTHILRLIIVNLQSTKDKDENLKSRKKLKKKEDYQKQKAIGLATDLSTAKVNPKNGGLYLKVGK